MFKKPWFFSILIILLFGLTPILWFSGNQIILGHDSGLPLRPIGHFQDRLYVWTDRYGFGLDQSFALPGFFIHGIEAFVSYLGASTQLEQTITFIFWLSLSGFSMYVFAYKFEKELRLKYFGLVAALFYMINHFLLQSWYIAERTKYSVYAALPLILYVLFEWSEKKRSTLLSSIILAFIIFLLNGGGAIPLFGGIIIAGLVFLFFYFLVGISPSKIFNVIGLIFWTGIFSVLLNAYWLAPYGFHVLHNYASEVTLFGGLNGILGWLSTISEDSSLINLLRLQGIPEWYQNPFQPYSSTFLNNPFFILISYLIPFCAFVPLLIYQEYKARKVILFFAFLALFSMIFVAGAHPPFGVFYIFLIKFVPGFVAFRTPFYKFAPALWLSYSMLLAFFVSFLLSRFERKKLRIMGVGIVFLGIYLLYNYPFFTGSFFNYMVGKRTTRVTVPNYISDYAEWSGKPENQVGKTLVIPPTDTDSRMDVFDWGYLSNQPFTSIISNAPIINKNYYMPSEQLRLIDGLYSQIKTNNPEWTKLANLLGIQYLLVRNDFDWDNQEYPTDNPQLYQKALIQEGFQPYKTFGKWIVYRVPQKSQNEVEIAYVVGSSKDIPLITSLPVSSNNEIYFIGGNDAGNEDEILQYAHKVYIMPGCIGCTLEKTFIPAEEHMPLLTRGSRVYELKLKVDKLLHKDKAPDDLLQHAFLTFSSSLAFQKVVDEKRDLPTITQTIIDYTASIKEFKAHLERYFAGQQMENEASYQQINDILESERNILLEKSIGLTTPEFTKELDAAYKGLTETQNFFESKYWHSDSEDDKKFIVNVPLKDTYTLMYKPDKLGQMPEKIQLDGQVLPMSIQSSSSGWLNVGSYQIEKGSHGMEVTEPIQNMYQGSQIINLTSDKNGKCVVSNRIDGKAGDVFHTSFEHISTQSNRNFYVIYLKNNKPTDLISLPGEQIDASPLWESYQSTKIIEKGDNHFYVGICFKPYRQSVTLDPAISIRNISIRKITVPSVFLYSDLTGKAIPFIQPNKKKQTNYTVDIPHTPAFIELNETYNQNWNMNRAANHFMVNGYANGWISQQGGSNIDIVYTPQLIAQKGFLVSGISLIVLGGLAFYLIKNEKNKKTN